jgi:hypothetical protein
MTAVDDVLTPNGGSALLTYNEVDRKVTLAEIANDSDGKLKAGKFERVIVPLTRTGGTAFEESDNAKLTVYVHDPACDATVTMVFNPLESA